MTGLAMATPGVKSREAFRTISEAATELDVPQHVLRFWETRFSQIRPVKRAGGRRYYRPEDIELLRGIQVLLYHDGYTVKGVQKVLRERGVRYATELGRNEAAARDRREPDTNDAPETHDAPDMESFSILEDFPRLALSRGLDDAQRGRLEQLLGELIELRTMLKAARAFAMP